MGLSTIFRAAAASLALLIAAGQAASAQTTTATAAPSALSQAISAGVSLCMPETFALPAFEQRASVAGWTAFTASAGGGHQWRVSDRNADPTHRLSIAASSGDFAGAPVPTRAFNCKLVLQPGAAEDFQAALGAVFGADQTDGGFFIRENGTLRPSTFQELLTDFPASLSNLHAGQRMVFMQVDQRGPAVVVSIDSYERR